MKLIQTFESNSTTQFIACPTCKSILEISVSDIRIAPRLKVYSYKCPCCKNKQIISDNTLVKGIKDELNRLY